MYLTKIVLNLKSKRTLIALSNANEMHKLIMSMFENIESETPRKDMGILYIMEIKGKCVNILIQSNRCPDGNKLLDEKVIDSCQSKIVDKVFDSIKNGNNIYLEVISEPYKKVENNYSKNSRRKILTNIHEKLDWFERKITENGGCVIENTLTNSIDKIYGSKGKLSFSYRPSVYKCSVKITDETKFADLLKNGLGSGKSYGMGMFKIYVR